MRYLKHQFTQEYYKLWESGLLFSKLVGGNIFFVGYVVHPVRQVSTVKINAHNVSESLELGCYAAANLHGCKPEDIHVVAIFDELKNLIWEQNFGEELKVSNSRREFLGRLALTSAALFMGFKTQKLYAGSTTAALSGIASGFTTASKGTLLDTNSYILIHATENDDYGQIIYATANGVRDLTTNAQVWSPSGAGGFYNRPGLKDFYMPGYGSSNLFRVTSVGGLSRSIGSNLLTTIGSNGTIISSAFFNSGNRVAAVYNFNGSGECRLMVWDTSTLPYTFGSYISLGSSGSVRVAVINDSHVIVFRGSEVSAYSVSGNSLTFISTTTFDSEANYLIGACCVNWESTWGEVLIMYQGASASNVYVKALRFHSTNGFTIYSNRVTVGTSSYSATYATILPIPYYRAIILTNPGKFKVLKCTDWSTWDGSSDGSETTVSTLQFLAPFGSHSGLPRFAGLYDNGGANVHACAMTVSDTSITAGAYCNMNSGYSGSARVNSWVRI